MKKILFFVFLALIGTGLYSFQKLENTYTNIFNQLELETEEAESYIISNILGGSTSFPQSKVMVSLALNKRTEAEKNRKLHKSVRTNACIYRRIRHGTGISKAASAQRSV